MSVFDIICVTKQIFKMGINFADGDEAEKAFQIICDKAAKGVQKRNTGLTVRPINSTVPRNSPMTKNRNMGSNKSIGKLKAFLSIKNRFW